MINPKFDQFSKKQTCLFGAMMGDALGVPFEFKKAKDIPTSYITHPLSIPFLYKTYRDTPFGVYSDDFSQSLCVEQCINDDTLNFGQELLLWMDGKYWVDNNLFDIGVQTASALYYYKKYETILHKEKGSGNGGIMRLAPVAFAHGIDHNWDMYVDLIIRYSEITHNNKECLNAAVFYCTLLGYLKYGTPDKEFNHYWKKTETQCGWTTENKNVNLGSGYVIDTLLSIKHCMNNSTDYTSAIIQAILLGNDTDTTATCVGAVAALYYGLKGIPDEWIEYIQPSLKNEYVQQLFKDVL